MPGPSVKQLEMLWIYRALQRHGQRPGTGGRGAGGIFNRPVDGFAARGRSAAAMSDPLDQIFAALADPTRRAILVMLLEDDMAVTDVAEPFAMSLAGDLQAPRRSSPRPG